jgi:hypothetical protein
MLVFARQVRVLFDLLLLIMFLKKSIYIITNQPKSLASLGDQYDHDFGLSASFFGSVLAGSANSPL